MPTDSYIPFPTSLDASEVNYERDMLGFIKEAIQESDNFLRAQPNFSKIEKSRRAIHSSREDTMTSGLSSVEANHTAKSATQLVAGMTDTRPFWEYRTFNTNYKKQTEVFGKLSLHLWLQRQWDMRWADMVRNCTTDGTSFAGMGWNYRLKMLDFTVEDCRDLLPFRPTDNHTIQTAFGVILRRERTVNYLRSMYPEFADFIRPDRDGADSGREDTRFNRLMQRLGSPFQEWMNLRNKPNKDIPRIPTADEYTIYLDDDRIHKGKLPLYMGDWHKAPVEGCPQCISSGTPHALNNWSYPVERGERVYPQKRLIIATSTCILYDNTSPYWHGMYPYPKLTLSPWSDTWIGKGLVWDALPMQKFLDRMLKVLDNHFQKWQQPDLFADKNSTARSEFNKINTARPGLKMLFNPVAGKGVELRYPDQLPAYFFEVLKFTIEEIGSLSGAQDMSALVQLRQLPSADSVERIMEAMTPQVRLQSRILEAFTREFATIVMYNIAQFMTESERMTILGPDGVVLEDFDYDPGTLIPDFVHPGDFDEQGFPTAAAIARGPMPRFNRAKEFLRQFSMHIAPGSLLSASEISDKLLYLQLWRDGGMDLLTLLDKLGIPNPDKILERLAAQAALSMAPQARVGRQPSAQEMPQIKQRTGGGTKVSESG